MGHLELARRIFGYLKKYPKMWYAINPQPLTIDVDYEKVQMNHDLGNHYAYFSEDIDEQFLEPFLDELGIRVFVDYKRGHEKVTGRSITWLFSVVGSTPTTWSSKRQTAVQTSKFSSEFTALKKAVEVFFIIRYHLR